MSNIELEKMRIEGTEKLAEEALEKTQGFLKRAFEDMKESAKAQHEVDKARRICASIFDGAWFE